MAVNQSRHGHRRHAIVNHWSLLIHEIAVFVVHNLFFGLTLLIALIHINGAPFENHHTFSHRAPKSLRGCLVLGTVQVHDMLLLLRG